MGSSLDSYRTRIYEKYVSMFKETQTTFDKETAIRWGRPYEYYFRNWLPREKSVAVLDIACGNGKLLYYFICHGYSNLEGVDICHEQVHIAQQVCSNVHEENVLDFLESHPDTFDVITGFDFIEHLHKDEVFAVLDGCYSALKTKGRLILQTPNSDSPMSNSVHHGDFTHEVQLNPSSLTNLLRLSGFDAIEVREQEPVFWGCGIKSSIRSLAWQLIRVLLKAWNIVETGGVGSGIFTRVFIISGVKS
jgi:SAM-dependent methyltransferase